MSALVSYSNADFRAEITDTGEGFRLWWTDHVVNEWEESYPDLSAAVGRLALLIAAAHSDRFFSGQPPEWYLAWTEFAGRVPEWHAAWTAFADLNLDPPSAGRD